MGCGGSKPARRRPADLIELAPRPHQEAAQEPEPQLTSDLLQNALGYMAQYMARKRRNLTVIGVGGIVNVILLRTRMATHDVDFFNDNLTPDDAALLREAISFAKKQMEKYQNLQMPAKWFNNQTTVFIKSALRRQLAREAMAQNEVVFSMPGLTMLAAPWSYAVCSKIHRISGGHSKRYDTSDAATYLHRYVSRNGLRQVRAGTIRQWGESYGIAVNDRDVGKVDDAYAQLYGSRIISR
ncbi:MAG: hypothetical protein Q9217_000081 [Psora testacea]